MSTALELARIREWTQSGRAKEIREQANVAQAEIARDIGTTSQTVSRWEAGKKTPTGEAALRYLRLLRALERRYDRAVAR